MKNFKVYTDKDGGVLVRENKSGVLFGWESEKELAHLINDHDAMQKALVNLQLAKEQVATKKEYMARATELMEQMEKVYFSRIHYDHGERMWFVNEAKKAPEWWRQKEREAKKNRKRRSRR